MALFFFFFFCFSKAKKNKKFKHKVWMLTQICHAIRVVLLLQKKQKKQKTKQKSECKTSPSELICTHIILLRFQLGVLTRPREKKKKGQRLRFNPPRFHFSYNNKMYSKRGACAFFLFFFFFFFSACATATKSKNWRLKREKSKRREQPVVRESVIIIEVEGSGRNGFSVIFCGLRVSQSDVTLDLRAAQKRPMFFSFSPLFCSSFHT